MKKPLPLKKESLVKYPRSYQGIKLKWVDNLPRFKKGDKVVVFKDGIYSEIELKTIQKDVMKVDWLRACWGCRKPNPMICDKWVYRWNKGNFTEGTEFNLVERLNSLNKIINKLELNNSELSKKASLYDQIKQSLDGELINNEW